MMTWTSRWRWRSMRWSHLAGALAVLAVSGERLAAQTGVVGGTVVDARTLRGLDGAQVQVDGTTLGALTDGSGSFRITGVSGAQVTLQVRRLGFKPATVTARSGQTDLRIVMSEQVASLSEVVITGTAEPVEKRAIGNAVTKVDAASLQSIAPAPDMTTLLNGKAAGVVMTGGSGAVGSGPRIRIRGAASLSLSDQPLIYVDGVRIANDVSTGPRSQFFSSGVISRLNDIDPENIESIEVIKGPAAATLYGTEANNGVIQIITKRGKAGRSVFTTNIRQGGSWFQNAEERIGQTYRRLADGTISAWNPVAINRAAGMDLFKTGLSQSYNLGLNGGTDVVKYNFTGSYDNDKGIEPTNSLWRWSGSGNVSLSPYKNLDIQAVFNTNQSVVNVPLEAGGGAWFSLYFGQTPVTDAEKLRRGYFSAPPEAFWGAFKQWQAVKRTTGSVQMTHRVGTWLNQRLVVGNDLTGEDNVNQTQRMGPFFRQFFTSPVDQNGNKATRRRELNVTSIDYAASLKKALFGVQTSTSFGAQYFRRQTYAVAARGEGFPSGGLTLVDAAATTFGGEDFFENSTVGFYGQEQVNLNDRMYLTAALRVDNNSAFGEDFNWVTYPKVSGTWVINEEPWFKFDWINSMKLRAAYGQTGQQPDVNSALRTYSATTGGDGNPAVTPLSLGNPSLKPERAGEIELGFDATFLNERVSAEVTWYRRDTKDGILFQDVPPSSGFAGQRVVNIGGIRSTGIELQTRYNALNRRNLNLDFGFNISNNDNEITSLGNTAALAKDPLGVPFIQIGGNRNTIGKAVMTWYDYKVRSATYNATTRRAENMKCDDGKGAGGVVDCLTSAGQPNAPRVFIGRADPSVEGSFNTTVTAFQKWRLYGLVDFKGGHRVLNNNDRARCQVFNQCMANIEPEKYDPVFVAQAQSNGILREFTYQKAKFARLREVSASYTLGQDLAGWVGARSGMLTLSGRNLALWTPYGGTDPENFFTLQQFVRLEQAQVPPLAQVLFSVSLSY
ncbi:MAG: SusC/RagA family TonB-linked outer membrane protein [Gemmatimonadetes bacterium]|nr:SusC/RagA family TonB-linked outer membrane protein [Gemmatimonadota bacterium]